MKIWKEEEGGDNRPSEIILQLLKDGDVYGEAVLSRENNWRYRWTGLPKAAQWTVVEKTVPDGYTVEVERNGNTFGVTNTRIETPSPTPEPEASIPPTPTQPPENKVPQTGQLWWPVPLLAMAGILFLVIGMVLKRKK